MSLTPKAFYSTSIANDELVPLAQAFDASDYPAELTAGTVRNHIAWLNEMDPGLKCNDEDATAPDAISSVAPQTEISRFDQTQTGNVMWVENGVVVHLVGPFPIERLISLAAQMTFE